MEEDDEIVEKQLAAVVPSCFSKATLLYIDFQKNAKQLRTAACSCFYGVRWGEKQVSTHLLTTILSSFGTFFHPLDPIKTAACSNGELFCVFLKIDA